MANSKMTNANKEENIDQEKIYKQGSKRKINANNFYYTIQYLYNLTLPPKDYHFDEDMTEKIHDSYFDSPKITSSKNHIESKIKELEGFISKNQDRIDFNNYHFNQSEKDCKEAIEYYKKSINKLRDSYVELDTKRMFELHSIVITLDDSIYKRMSNWVKQQRSRDKVEYRQVTMSIAAKNALESLKYKLNAKNYNETLIKLDRKTDYE
jgi:hypothetical protein